VHEGKIDHHDTSNINVEKGDEMKTMLKHVVMLSPYTCTICAFHATFNFGRKRMNINITLDLL
jgi:hypothetical protein